jgi:NADPH:quinone reductase
MKAIVLDEFGGPEVLRYADVATPKVEPGKIVIKVHSVSVNRTLDCVIRSGKYPTKIQLPHVLGADPAGEIADIGEGATRFKVGDRVAVVSAVPCQSCLHCRNGNEAHCASGTRVGVDLWGGDAEYVAVPERHAFKLPDNVSFAEGTVITRHFPMAFQLLAGKTTVKPGETVLVMGAAGALGSCCVQVAKMFGARVIAAAGTDERVELAKSYGADLGINYRTQDLAREVMTLTDRNGANIVCENISDPTLWSGAFNSMAVGGRMVTAGAHGGGKVTLDVKTLYLRRLSILGAAGTHPLDVEKALAAAREEMIHAVPWHSMPLGMAAEAHRIVEQNQFNGKIILELITG